MHRKLDPAQKFRMLHPSHLREIAEALRGGGGRVEVSCTSAGLRISSGEIVTEAGVVRQYAFSLSGRLLEREVADVIAALIIKLRHPAGSPELVPGNHGVFHLLVREAAQKELMPR